MNLAPGLILCVVCGAALTAFLCGLVSRPLLGILQQEGYGGAALLRYLYKKGNMQRKRLSLLALSLALLTALVSLCFCFLPMPYPGLCALVPHFGLYGLYLFSEQRHALKVPLSPTPRAVRLAVVHTVLLMLVCSGLGIGLAALSVWADVRWLYLLRFVPFAVLPLLLPVLLCLSNAVMKLYEVPHAKKFVRRAASVLAESGCVKVGITGSFGKTSVKSYAAHILSFGGYRVKATPASYNTPLGIAKFVNGEGADCDVFLAEMGARRRGDIAELCDMVKPAVGLVTGICPQHLETFGSIETIRAEKGVLASRAERTVLGASARGIGEGTLEENRDFAAENIELSERKTKFVLRIGEQTAPVEVPLLGRHAAQDIALAAALCSLLGMEFSSIVAAISSLTPVPHRLERTEGDIVILDDSYNSNVEGAKDAVEVLRLHEGGKVIVTPGLVELGELEEGANEALGASLAGLDLVVLVGETRVLSLRNGYLGAGGEGEKLVVVPTLEAAKQVLAERVKAGDCVLFLNDLPDKYL